MYTPAQFKVEDAGEAHAMMRAHPFAILVTHGQDGLTATHLSTGGRPTRRSRWAASSVMSRGPTRNGRASRPMPRR